MATTTDKSAILDPSEARVMFKNAGWVDYEKMLEVVGERRMHVTYFLAGVIY